MVNGYVVLGCGISGLTLALELLRAGKSVTLLEGSNSVGGLARTVVMEDYVVDYGPHLFHSAHPEIIDYWRELVGDALVSKDFYSGNFRNGIIYDYPVNTETAPDQYSPDEYERIKLELSEIDSGGLVNASNYYEYVRSLAGNFLAESFFTKYPKKLWGIDTKNLSARFAPRRIEIREKRLPFHSGPGRFAGIIEGGCGVLAERLKEEIEKLGGLISLNTQIVKFEIDDRNNISSLVDQAGSKYDINEKCLISTIPINSLASLLGYSTKLYFRHILLVNIVFRGVDLFPNDYDWLYFDDESVPFHRVGVQTRFSRLGIKDDLHILCCEVAFNQDDILDLQGIEQECVDALDRFGLLDKGSVVRLHNFNIGPVYPGYYIGHELELNRVNGLIGRHRNLYQTGSLADYAYSDLQVLTAKSIDLAKELLTLSSNSSSEITKTKAAVKPVSEFKFGRSLITSDDCKPPFLIAEIGLCHNGSVDLCKELIRESKNTGFSAAKIQTYQEGRISKRSRTSRYFEETLDQEESLSDQIDKLIFSKDELADLFDFANKLDFDLFSTPFDFDSAALLNDLDVPGFKISSMDLVNIPLIRFVAAFGKPVILSTGMATVGEIEAAVNSVLEEGNEKVCVLHCVSSYPCPIEESNFERIRLIEKTFGVVPGFSDHTVEPHTPAFSLAFGARVIEKHVTLDKGLDGPDHNFSLIPAEMKMMNELVGNIFKAANGNGFRPSDVELAAKSNLRRSLYAKGRLNRGDIMTMDNLAIKSPGDGIPVKYLHLLLGKRIIRSVEDDYPVSWGDFLNE